MHENMGPRPAYVEDEGEEDTTRVYASAAPPPPLRERPNSGKSRERLREQAIADTSSEDLVDSDSDDLQSAGGADARLRAAQEMDRKAREAREKERRRQAKPRPKEKEQDRKSHPERASRGAKEVKPSKKTRPPLHPAATQPVISHHPQYSRHPADPPFYGVSQPGGPPRLDARSRPASYYAGQPIRQPPARTPIWQQEPMSSPVGTFPPPMMPPASPMMYQRPSVAPYGPPSNDYFVGHADNHERLRQRLNRPSSAMGGKPSGGFAHAPYEPPSRPSHGRHPSHLNRQDPNQDRYDMPPPNFVPQRRTSSAMPSSQSAFRPPPQPVRQPSVRQHRPSISHHNSSGSSERPQFDFEDDDYHHDNPLFQDMSPQAHHDRSRGKGTRHRRESHAEYSGEYQLAPASGRRSARSSLYGPATTDSDDYDGESAAVAEAESYMHLAGGSKTPLTENLLREANRRSGVSSSRSTHSSASRDDSDYRRSNTTGPTTQYSVALADHDGYTVKLPAGARLRGNGFEVDLVEPGEITVSRPSRDRSTSELEVPAMPALPQIEDGQSSYVHRALTHRTRAPSQSDSLHRGHDPRWAPSSYHAHAPYDPHLAAGNAF